MLGSGLGKKVDANFIKDQYQNFLQRKTEPAKKRPLTKEEKRAEARKKGIFVVADDTDFTPTEFERTAAPNRPAVIKEVPRPMRWKKQDDSEHKTKSKSKKQKKPKTPEKPKEMAEKVSDKTSESKSKDKKRKEVTETRAKPKKSKTDLNVRTARLAIVEPAEEKIATARLPIVESAEEKISTAMEDSRRDPPIARGGFAPALEEASPPAVVIEQPAHTEAKTDEPAKVRAEVVAPVHASSTEPAKPDESAKVYGEPPEPSYESVKEPASPVKDSPVKMPDDIVTAQLPSANSDKDGSVRTAVDLSLRSPQLLEAPHMLETARSSPSDTGLHSDRSASAPITFTAPEHAPLQPKDDVFEKMDDEEFEKHLDQENKNLTKADKASVDAARRILKAAHRQKAFEKVLTKEENEILAKFFSGKIPYDKKVLKTLDTALDKTIDFLRANHVKLDEETKELINKRGMTGVKAAMFEAILSSPQYIPQSWAKKYVELVEESKKETEGINWARVLVCYPPQKSLADGPEDQFGNFTRSSRNWLLGCLFGPGNYKTIEETKREETCKGMYLDSAFMEKANKAAQSTNGLDASLSVRSVALPPATPVPTFPISPPPPKAEEKKTQ